MQSDLLYALVFICVAFSQMVIQSCTLRKKTPNISEAAFSVSFFTRFGNSPRAGPGGGCRVVSRVSVFPRWTVLYQKHSKDTEETSVLLLHP